MYRYPLLNALDDGILAPLTSVNLYVDFTADERIRWKGATDEIGHAFRALMHAHPELECVADEMVLVEVGKLAKREDPLALRILGLLSERRELLASAHARSSCQESILQWIADSRKRGLVFHETIAAAKASHNFLTRRAGISAGLDHSGLHRIERDKAMEDFRRERSQVLVAVRALDEGVDVPDASVAVIAAGSRSRRQRIQRFGRVLGPGPGKKALVVTILVRNTPEEAAVGGRDNGLLGGDRVRHHRWPGIAVETAVTATMSTYRPDEPEYSVADLLTLHDLGLWEPSQGTLGVRHRVDRKAGGYGVREVQFSPNAWYRADEVRTGMGMPHLEFENLRRDIRRAFRLSLDAKNAEDQTLIHGSEIDAVRREWHRREKNRLNVGERTRR